MMKANRKHIFAFGSGFIERMWTKKDLLVHMNATESIEGSTQTMATVVIVRNTPEGRGFVADWLRVMESDYDLITDSPSKIPNHPTFQQHRHDQSVFSVLVKMRPEEAMTAPDETWWPKSVPENRSSLFPFHALRDKSPLRAPPPPASHRVARKEAMQRLVSLDGAWRSHWGT